MQEAGREIFDGDEKNVSETPRVSPLQNWLKSEAAVRVVYGVFGFLLIALIVSWLQFSTRAICCGDYDGYYHIRWSQLLWENFSQGKWLPEFKWLPLTVLAPDTYADHHFLFHLLQIPFLWFFDPIWAAKIAAVFYATLALFSCYWLVLRYKVEYPLVWLLGLLTCSGYFFFRINMAKAPPLAIIFTVLGAFLLFERRYVWLLPLTFFFVWTYSLFPMLIIAAVIWAVILAWNEGVIEWKPFAYTVGGAIAGNIVNPYFPRNVGLFVEHLQTKIRVSDYSVPVGGEWYPYDSWTLLGLCAIAFLAMIVGYVLYQPSEKRLDEKSTFFLVFATFLMIWTFQSKRFAEYFPPFAILFAAFASQAFAARLSSNEPVLPEDFRLEIEPYLDKTVQSEPEEKREFWKTAFVSLLCVLLLITMFFNLHGLNIPSRKIEIKGVAGEIAGNDPPERYERATEWMVMNIPEGERIFNTDWDDFPKLFFHDQKHVYVSGLDPNYLFSRNPELSKLYEDITTGKVDDPAPDIREKFGARWVFSDQHHDDFYVKAIDSGWFEKVYEDDDSFVLKMRDQKGAAPDEAADAAGSADDNVADDLPDDEETNSPEENSNQNQNANK